MGDLLIIIVLLFPIILDEIYFKFKNTPSFSRKIFACSYVLDESNTYQPSTPPKRMAFSEIADKENDIHIIKFKNNMPTSFLQDTVSYSGKLHYRHKVYS